MAKPTTRQMSDAHEEFLAALIDGQRMPGSGNKFNNQMDVRNDYRRQQWPFCFDGKSTFAKSITITETMWTKAVEQAHTCEPGLALRWYHDERLRTSTDLIVVRAADFGHMLEELRG